MWTMYAMEVVDVVFSLGNSTYILHTETCLCVVFSMLDPTRQNIFVGVNWTGRLETVADG